MMQNDLTEIRSRFVECVGTIAKNEGMPPIAGKMFGLLVFEKGPFSFSEVAVLLQVSRASISSNARILEERGVIERVVKPGDRQDYFQLADEPYSRTLESAIFRSVKANKAICSIAADIPDESVEIKGRLDQYASFYEHLAESMGGIVESLRDHPT